MLVRVLNYDDTEKVLELEQKTTKHMRVDKNKDMSDFFAHNIKEYLDPENTNKILWGAFDGDELISINGIFVWNTLPFYTQVHLKTSGYRHWRRNGVAECWSAMLQYGEEHGRYTFYYVRSAHDWSSVKISEDFFKRVPAYNRYVRSVDEYIPANARSKYPYFDSIMLGKSWSTATVVIQAVLRPEFRNHADLNNSVPGVDYDTAK